MVWGRWAGNHHRKETFVRKILNELLGPLYARSSGWRKKYAMKSTLVIFTPPPSQSVSLRAREHPLLQKDRGRPE